MKILLLILCWVVISVFGVTAFFASFVLLSKKIGSIPMLLIVSIVIAFFTQIVLGLIPDVLIFKSIKLLRVGGSSLSIILVLIVALKFTMFSKLPGPVSEKVIPKDTKYIELTTSSSIAYWEYEGVGEKKDTPIVFVHGGPGAYVRDIDRDFFKTFTNEGYDVYLYDQPGGGFSDYIPISDYTMENYVSDIEQLRISVGAEKIILVGQSFGALISSVYLTEHTDRVESIIFTSPGELRTTSIIERNNENRQLKDDGIVFASEKLEKFEPTLKESVRFATVILMCKYGSPQMAEKLVSQEEMTDYVTRSLPEAIGKSYSIDYIDQVPNLTGGGINVHSNLVMQKEYESISVELIDKMKNISTPALIIRTEFDYVMWDATKYYNTILSNSSLVYITESGHIPWSINIDDTYQAMVNFIKGDIDKLIVYELDTNPRKAID